MPAIAPRWLVVAAQPQPRLMNQRRRLQRMRGLFASHLRRRKLMQFGVDTAHQFRRGIGLAPTHALEHERDFRHSFTLPDGPAATRRKSDAKSGLRWSAVRLPLG